MSKLFDMTLLEAVQDSGSYFVTLLQQYGDWQRVAFPVPEFNFQEQIGTPIMVIRYVGNSDNGNGFQTTKLPRSIRFLFSAYYGFYQAPVGVEDSYEYAQLRALEGESNMREALLDDVMQDGRFINTRFEDSTAGDTADSNGNPFYGNITLVNFDIH